MQSTDLREYAERLRDLALTSHADLLPLRPLRQQLEQHLVEHRGIRTGVEAGSDRTTDDALEAAADILRAGLKSAVWPH
jgi:hypothetical protein